ncbi:hypothetical protein KEJ39_08665, partial [Candidatus Bathyarchaeota archaeon]|nr:hypothetical protein [Candidatus Bathyarchaeota archaeon]
PRPPSIQRTKTENTNPLHELKARPRRLQPAVVQGTVKDLGSVRDLFTPDPVATLSVAIYGFAYVCAKNQHSKIGCIKEILA